eukprot:GILK01000357.1.p1 GENE.GILK01000357.1~~GILK01000357.1.p1  ORF type:complete len:511 (+),score=84.62 GILK01000357.1:23-1555(+)
MFARVVGLCVLFVCVALVSAGGLTRSPAPVVDKDYQVGYEFQVHNSICRLAPHEARFVLRKGVSLANERGASRVFAEADEARGFAVQADDDVLPNLFYVEYVTKPFGSDVDAFCHMFGELSTEMERVAQDITEVEPTRLEQFDFGHGNVGSDVDVYESNKVFPNYNLKCYWDKESRKHRQPAVSHKGGRIKFTDYYIDDRQFLMNGQATITIDKDRVYDFLVDPHFAGRFLYDATSLTSFDWASKLQDLAPNTLIAKASNDDVKGFIALVALYIRESKEGHPEIPKQDIPVLSRTDFAVWHRSLSAQLTFAELCEGVSMILLHMEAEEHHFELGANKQRRLAAMKNLVCGIGGQGQPFVMFEVKGKPARWSITSKDWIQGLTLPRSVDRLTQSGSRLSRNVKEYYESMGFIKQMDMFKGRPVGVRFEIRKLMDAVHVGAWAPMENNLCAAIKAHLYIVKFNQGESVDVFDQPCPALTSQACKEFLAPLREEEEEEEDPKNKLDNPEEVSE